ncbi:MAG: toll/interleukin-1 receptor domain-containing protein [Desulfobacterales bacterium]|nr:toll/interleukin-1 receptor domain-containing protein [Desulfobacterales bacterium]
MAGYVHGYRHDIFVSYAEIDNESGWISTFMKDLRKEVGEKINKNDVSLIDHQSFYDISEAFKNTAVMVVILSRNYLLSEQWEKDSFLKMVREQHRSKQLFVVEYDKIDQPHDFSIRNYRFWTERGEGSSRPFGYPKPDPDNPDHQDYYDYLKVVIDDIAGKLKLLREEIRESEIREESEKIKVFISYADEDYEIAKRLYNDLNKYDIEPWLKSENLLPGQNKEATINKAIKESSCFIALFSSNLIGKRHDAQKELKTALQIRDEFPSSEIYLIPVRIDKCEHPDMKLHNIQMADLFPFYSRGLKKIIQVLRSSDDKNEPDTLPAVFLAEVTHDLIEQRNEVEWYLRQEGFRVMPDEPISHNDVDAFAQAVEGDLAHCEVFVQLLSDLPLKMCSDSICCNYLQYERAKDSEIEIMQWRSPMLDLNALKDRKHQSFLEKSTVFAGNLEEFKREVVKRTHKNMKRDSLKHEVAKRIHKNMKCDPLKSELKTDSIHPLVFLNANYVDESLVKPISNLMEKNCVAYASSLYDEDVLDILKDIEMNLLVCNGVVVVYGKAKVVWVREQLLECRRVMYRREQPLKVLAVYEGPPDEKKPLNISFPNMFIINCRKSLNEQEFRRFFDDLKEGVS